MKARLLRSWFLTLLAAAMLIGMGMGPVLGPLADATPRDAVIAAIMLLTALPIDFARSVASRAAWIAVGLAAALNSIAGPLLGWAASYATPPELAVGVIVASTSPCTLASGAVWTRRGGGNDAVAILATLVTNLGCFVTIPLWLGLMLGPSLGVEPPPLGAKLLICVVAPIAAAQALRLAPGVAAWATRHKPSLSLAAQLGVLLIAFLGSIEAGRRLQSLPEGLGPAVWLAVPAAMATLHVTLLAAGWLLSRAIGLPRGEQTAVAIAGSQKTLAVGAAVALEFGGLAIFPMIAYHVLQLLIDTVFVDRLRAAETRPSTTPASSPAVSPRRQCGG
ncbi:MAG: bile acid:sodium symporter [Planctomycetota bacterium]